MAFYRRMTPEREELILAGNAPAGGGDAEIAEFATALRTLPEQPRAEVSAVIVSRLAEAARIGDAEAPAHSSNGAAPTARRARPRRRLALVARIAVAVALLPLLMAGLAFAGVELPDVADDAFESVGIDLPNQGSGDSGTEETGTDGGGPSAVPGDQGRTNADEKRGVGNGKGQGKVPDHAGSGGPPSHSNAGGNGKNNAPPAHSNAGGNTGSGGQGSAEGGGGGKPAEPPGGGQTNKPEIPGSSGSAGTQGQDKDN